METRKNYSNVFPIDVFPSKIIEVMLELTKSLNYPLEYIGSSILSAASVAIGNTYQVKKKNGWYAKANLFMVLVGRSGDGKTHPIEFAYKPIVQKDKDSYIEYKMKLAEYEMLSPKEKKNNEKPHFTKFILNDFTPESLIKIHSHNTRGIAIVADELAGWIKNFNRYTTSGEQETYLQLWNGNTISIDRKGDEPIRLDNTYVNIIGGIQTKVLPILGKENRDNNGFLERFIFVILENTSLAEWNDNEANPDVISNYSFMIEKLFSLGYNDFEPNIIEFTDESKKVLNEWRNKKRLDYFNDDTSNSIWAKYETYTIRFSLIIQLMFWAMEGKSNNWIDLFAVEKAIKLTEYYFLNAKEVHNIINNFDPLDKLNKVEKVVYNSLSDHFGTKEALEVANESGMNDRTMYRFLKNANLYIKVKKGIYEKIAL